MSRGVSIAIAPRRACLLVDGRGQYFEHDGDIGAFIARCSAAAGAAGASVSVALAGGLGEVRRLTMPRMAPDDLDRVLARDAARYFLLAREPVVVATERLSRHGSPVPVLAVAVPAATIVDIEDAVRAAAWRLEGVAPAASAWLSAARRGVPSFSTGGTLVVDDGATLLIVSHQSGVLGAPRKLRADPANWPALVEILAGAAPVALMGNSELADWLRESGVTVHEVPGDVLEIAAREAPRASGPALRTERRRAADRRGSRRLAAVLGAAAAACLLLAAGVQLVGVNRELASVSGQREALRRQVSVAMARRDTSLALEEALTTLARLESGAPRWASVLSDLAEALPRDAYLVGFRGIGDSVAIEGVARQASNVFQAVERMPGMASVRAQSPIRQGLTTDGAVQERFVLGGELRR